MKSDLDLDTIQKLTLCITCHNETHPRWVACKSRIVLAYCLQALAVATQAHNGIQSVEGARDGHHARGYKYSGLVVTYSLSLKVAMFVCQ